MSTQRSTEAAQLALEWNTHIVDIVSWMSEYILSEDPYVGGYISFLRTGGMVVNLDDFDCKPGGYAVFSFDKDRDDQQAVLVDLYIRSWHDMERNVPALHHACQRALEAFTMDLEMTVEVGYSGDSPDGISPLRNYELLMPDGTSIIKRPCAANVDESVWLITEVYLGTNLVAVRTPKYVLLNAAYRTLCQKSTDQSVDEAGYIRYFDDPEGLVAIMKHILTESLQYMEAHPETGVRLGIEDREWGIDTVRVRNLRPWPQEEFIPNEEHT